DSSAGVPEPRKSAVLGDQDHLRTVAGATDLRTERRLQSGDARLEGKSPLLKERAEPLDGLAFPKAHLRMLVDALAQRDEVVPHRVEFPADAILQRVQVVHR